MCCRSENGGYYYSAACREAKAPKVKLPASPKVNVIPSESGNRRTSSDCILSLPVGGSVCAVTCYDRHRERIAF
jgi:hypothetical protein